MPPRLTNFAGALLSASLLTACGGSGNLASSPAAMPPVSRIGAPAASSGGDLLYVDQGYSFGHNRGVVVIYTYPGDAYVAQFTVANPGYPPATTEGICSDRKGDVFIEAEYYYGTTMYEYAHGGTSPIATLADGGNGYANDCSSDPKTDNLAVVSRSDPDASGDIAIFKHAKGTPKTYNDPSMSDYYSCGYDNEGNLFIEGRVAKGIGFTELPAGSSTFTDIALSKPLNHPGRVQWDGKHITIQDAVTIYRLSISGSTGTVVGSTKAHGLVHLDYIYNNQIIAPHGRKHNDIAFWPYPSGGKPVDVIATNVANLYSATISVAPK